MPTSKSTRSPAFQFYPRDFLSSGKVDNMSMTERGVYITLLSRCWLDNGLPTDLKALAKFARMKPQQFERIWTVGELGGCFFTRGGRLHNERLDVERKVQADYRKKQKANADKRWSGGNATALPEKDHGNAPQSSSSSASALEKPSLSVSADDVVNVWNQLVTPPIPKVTKLTADRRTKIEARIRAYQDLAVWHAVIAWLNTQDWCRASGRGEHPNWTATLDWLCKSDGNIQKLLERIETQRMPATLGPRPVNPAKEAYGRMEFGR